MIARELGKQNYKAA
ncbi:hypothetical protein ACYRA4_004966 [Escherichia coli]|nr:hypothetical protein [Escherichia coli]